MGRAILLLLLGVPINLFVYSTKIRDLVAYEPPEYAPATALGSIFLLVLLIMVVLQRRYLGQRLYRTVSGRGFSTNPTSLGRWRWPIFSAVALIAFTVTVVPLVVLLMGTWRFEFWLLALLLAVSTAACWLPAWRASRSRSASTPTGFSPCMPARSGPGWSRPSA